MKKMKMKRENSISFEQGCNLYLNNCRERNLREGTIKHYKQSYDQFYKYFDRDNFIFFIIHISIHFFLIILSNNRSRAPDYHSI